MMKEEKDLVDPMAAPNKSTTVVRDQKKLASAHKEVLEEHSRFRSWEYYFYVALALFTFLVTLLKLAFDWVSGR